MSSTNAKLFRAVILSKCMLDGRPLLEDNAKLFSTLESARKWLCILMESYLHGDSALSAVQQTILTAEWYDGMGTEKLEYTRDNGDVLFFYIQPYEVKVDEKITSWFKPDASARDVFVASTLKEREYTCSINTVLEEWDALHAEQEWTQEQERAQKQEMDRALALLGGRGGRQ